MKNSDSQPEPQNSHLKPLGPVYKVCVQGTLSNVTEMAVIKSAHPARVPACVCSPQRNVLACFSQAHLYFLLVSCLSTCNGCTGFQYSALGMVLACLKIQCSKGFKLHKLFKECVGYQRLNTGLAASFSVIRIWAISNKRHEVMNECREEWLCTSR